MSPGQTLTKGRKKRNTITYVNATSSKDMAAIMPNISTDEKPARFSELFIPLSPKDAMVSKCDKMIHWSLPKASYTSISLPSSQDSCFPWIASPQSSCPAWKCDLNS